MSKPFENEAINQDEEKLILSDKKLEQMKKKKKRIIIITIAIMIGLMLSCMATFLIIGLYPKSKPTENNLIEVLLTKERIEKSSIDERDIRIIKLDNGLIATLISDSSAVTYSVGMQVHVGYDNDGEIRGLAHFSEHMLFLGSKAYPKVNFMSFVIQNGGSSNAETDLENTVYYFRINPSGYDKALDMFCRMFNESLLEAEYIEKEINAVNSEFLMYLNNDEMREFNIISDFFGGKFSIGNTESLKEKGLQELLNQVKALIKQHYVADQMKLVIISHESLDDLQNRAYKYFGYLHNSTHIKNENKDLSIVLNNLIPKNPFAFHNLGNIGWFKTVSNQVSIDFVITYPILDFKSDPLDFIFYILHDYNKGSFLYKFIENNYINSFKVNSVRNTTDHIEFYLHYGLTQKGIENLETFIKQYFSYINKLREKPISQSIFEEYKKASLAKFSFSIPNSEIRSLPVRMQRRASDLTYLLHEEPSISSSYDGKLIQNGLNYFSVDNCLILISSCEDMAKFPIQNIVDNYEVFFNEKTDYYFKTKYNVHKITTNYIEMLKKIKEYDEFTIRNTNMFITDEKKLIPCNDLKEVCDKEYKDTVPIEVINLSNCHIYYKVN